MHVLIYGADGATGSRLVTQALEAGHTVRASVIEAGPDLRSDPALTWVESDLLAGDGLVRDLDGIDAVLNAVGIDVGPTTALSPPPLHSKGTRNLVGAMRQADVTRLVTISASFVKTMARGPIWFEVAARMGLKKVFDDMAAMEDYLRDQTDIAWTAVRPGWLLDEEKTADYRIFPAVIPEDLIRTRTGDLAHFMLACAEDGTHIHETPAIARPEPSEKSGPDAVLAEMLA